MYHGNIILFTQDSNNETSKRIIESTTSKAHTGVPTTLKQSMQNVLYIRFILYPTLGSIQTEHISWLAHKLSGYYSWFPRIRSIPLRFFHKGECLEPGARLSNSNSITGNGNQGKLKENALIAPNKVSAPQAIVKEASLATESHTHTTVRTNTTDRS